MVDSFSDIDPLDTSNLDQGDIDDLYKSQVRGIVKSYQSLVEIITNLIKKGGDRRNLPYIFIKNYIY